MPILQNLKEILFQPLNEYNSCYNNVCITQHLTKSQIDFLLFSMFCNNYSDMKLLSQLRKQIENMHGYQQTLVDYIQQKTISPNFNNIQFVISKYSENIQLTHLHYYYSEDECTIQYCNLNKFLNNLNNSQFVQFRPNYKFLCKLLQYHLDYITNIELVDFLNNYFKEQKIDQKFNKLVQNKILDQDAFSQENIVQNKQQYYKQQQQVSQNHKVYTFVEKDINTQVPYLDMFKRFISKQQEDQSNNQSNKQSIKPKQLFSRNNNFTSQTSQNVLKRGEFNPIIAKETIKSDKFYQYQQFRKILLLQQHSLTLQMHQRLKSKLNAINYSMLQIKQIQCNKLVFEKFDTLTQLKQKIRLLKMKLVLQNNRYEYK